MARTAPTAAGPEALNKIDLKLGYACERQCLFCVQGDLRRRFPRPLPAADVMRALRDGRPRADCVVFTGGEPTLYPYLPELVRFARLSGYARIQIQSNGRRFSDPAFCRRLADEGANEFALSIHGSTPEVHDALTDTPGSFERVWRGIGNLLALGRHVITNTVVTRLNAPDLPALAARLSAYGARHIQFAFVHIVGKAADNAGSLVPRAAEAMPFVRAAIDAGRAGGARCFTEAVPLCLLKGYEDCAAERLMPAMSVYHADGGYCADFTRERVEVQKKKGPRCRDCVYDAACEGPWREYPDRFGWEEFVPVRGWA